MSDIKLFRMTGCQVDELVGNDGHDREVATNAFRAHLDALLGAAEFYLELELMGTLSQKLLPLQESGVADAN